MRYEDFTIRVFAERDGGYDVGVESPEGSTQAHVKLPPDLQKAAAELSQWHRVVRGAGTRDVEMEQPASPSAVKIGHALYKALFSGSVARLFDRSHAALKDPEAGLRIRLHLNLEDPAIAKLAQIPWEYVYEKESMEYLALSRQTPVVRYIDVPRRPSLLPFGGTLRILVVMSSPTGTHPLDLEKERKLIESTWAGDDAVHVDFLEHPTADSLFSRLVNEKYHVLHYMGHGAYDEDSGSGALVLETSDGLPQLLSSETLGTWLRDAPSLRLAFLNACDTGRAGDDEPFSGVANRLVMAGLPAVLAMQSPISDSAAIDFARAFYPRLAAGFGVDEASAQGRKAILTSDKQSTEWGIPVLYMRAPDGRLFDTPVPGASAASSVRSVLIGAAVAACVAVAAALAINFWPDTTLEFAYANNPLSMHVGDSGRVVLASQNRADSNLDVMDYFAYAKFADPSDAGKRLRTAALPKGELSVATLEGGWHMDVTALDEGTVPFEIRVERSGFEQNGVARQFTGEIIISVDPAIDAAYNAVVEQMTLPAVSTLTLLQDLRKINAARLDPTRRAALVTHIEELERLSNMRQAAIQSAGGARPSTAELQAAVSKLASWQQDFQRIRKFPADANNPVNAAALAKLASVQKTLAVTRRCLAISAPSQLSDDLYIARNGAVVFDHCYYLAEGKKSCNATCARANRTCDLEGLVVAAQNVSKCETVVKAIGADGTFQEVKARSGVYKNDLSGCTFGDWEKGNIKNGVQQKDNRWIQVMRKDGKPPTCAAINGDAKRMRVCACR